MTQANRVHVREKKVRLAKVEIITELTENSEFRENYLNS